jgi:hypothetical protein
MDQGLVNLIVGFVLTSVLGGALGSILQQRTWNHQNEVRLKEEELKQAKDTSEAISQLLDKRLYRMLRLYYAISDALDSSFSQEVLKERLHDYDLVLFEWNDRLNMNLALVGTYFGESARRYLDATVYESFKEAGGRLEQAYRAVGQGASSQGSAQNIHLEELRNQLDQLNNQIYQLGVFMMTQLREGKVGRSAPNPLRASVLKDRGPS